jgi:hypothetical protein
MSKYDLKAILAEAEIIVKEHKRAVELHERYHHPLESDGCMRVPAELIVEMCKQRTQEKLPGVEKHRPEHSFAFSFLSSPKGFALRDYVDSDDKPVHGRDRTMTEVFCSCYGGSPEQSAQPTKQIKLSKDSVESICSLLRSGFRLTDAFAGFSTDTDMLTNEDAKLIFNTYTEGPRGLSDWDPEPDASPDVIHPLTGRPKFIEYLITILSVEKTTS